MKVIMKRPRSGFSAYSLFRDYVVTVHGSEAYIAGYDKTKHTWYDKLVYSAIYAIPGCVFNLYYKTFCQRDEDYIRIDDWDYWSADHTLSKIIKPLLEKFRDCSHTIGYVDDEDVPEEMVNEDRWNWVLNEMIYAHECIANGTALDRDQKTIKRIENGLRLFGKYYMSLWD